MIEQTMFSVLSVSSIMSNTLRVTSADSWTSLAGVLAEMPDVCRRLLAEHGCSASGHCTACTTPGRGTPNTRYPCSLATIATVALKKHSNVSPRERG